ncbi:MAG TPA: hypothetical protein ENH45_06540, partial [Nitrospirae bacterium]|nr:hypothetical protein [Nitrospirota bacterium]
MNRNDDQMKNIGGILKKYQSQLFIASLFLLVFVLMWDMGKSQNQPQKYEIGYSQFMEQLELGNVISVTLKALHLTGELKKDTSIYIDQYKTTRPVTFFKTYL